MNKSNFIDVDYEDYTKENKHEDMNDIINGEPLFFTTTQVAQMLNEEPSKIRFYTKRFDKILNIETSNRNRQFKKSDIEKLKFIIKLKTEDGFTLQQIEDYCSSKGFDLNNIENSVLNSNNPLAIQAFVTAITVELDKKIDDKLNQFADKLIDKFNENQQKSLLMQNKINDQLQETIAVTIDELVTEKLNSSLTEFKSYLDTKEQQATKRDTEMLNTLRQHMKERKEMQLQLEQEKKKSIWSRIFGK